MYSGQVCFTESRQISLGWLLMLPPRIKGFEGPFEELKNLQNITEVKSKCRKGPTLSHISIPNKKFRYLDL